MFKRISPKKMLAVLVTALIALMVVVPATADPLPPATGNLHIHKYIGGPTGDVADGTEIDTGGWTSVVAVNGVQFNLFKVNTSAGIPDSGETYVLDGTNLKVFDSSGTLLGTFPVTPAGSVVTADDGTAIAENLAQGLYLVIEDTDASTNITNAETGEQLFISAACAPFLVAVPMTNPQSTGWLTDVHVYPKNEALTVDKEVSADEAVAVGDTVSYTITVSIPVDIATSEKYDIIDVLDPALDFVAGSVTVKTLPTNTAGLTQGATGDYYVTYDSGTRTLKVSFSETGRGKLAGFSHVQVSFDATVNASILAKLDLTVKNTGKVEFTNENDMDYEATSDGDDADIHTAAIKVTKTDEFNAALNGASFKIATSLQNAEAGRFMRLDSTTGILYDYDASPTSKWATLGAGADYTVSPNNVGTFVGLRDEVNGVWQTYYIVETKAPSGFNLLSEPIMVTFEGEEANYTYGLTVKNHSGFTLPATGGTGTILFTVVGIMLLGTAIMLVITKRKKSGKERF